MATERRRFDTVGEDGRIVEVVEFQHWVTLNPLSGPQTRLPGSTELFTSSGKDVTPHDGGTYKIVMTDEVLRPV